jgi:uncharacterized iron-regulated membrane protein
MNQLKLWLRHPQNLWLRRAVFQIHFWSGLILGLYVFLVCATGSILVFRTELYDLLLAKTKVVVSGDPLTTQQLTEAAQRTYPGYTVQNITPGRFPSEAADIVLTKGWHHKDRVFDPYVGRDIGPSVWIYYNILHWASDMHGNLMMGDNGLIANGAGGFLLAMMCITGMIVWWPGTSRWLRSMTLRRGETWKRFNWNLHSVIGFWTFSLILMWGLTGAYFVFPQPFRAVIGVFTTINPPRPPRPPQVAQRLGNGAVMRGQAQIRRGPRRPPTKGQKILAGFSAAHYGTFGGWPVKALWVMLGLAPPMLFLTGLLMWWNRVLGPAARRLRGLPPIATIEPELRASNDSSG